MVFSRYFVDRLEKAVPADSAIDAVVVRALLALVHPTNVYSATRVRRPESRLFRNHPITQTLASPLTTECVTASRVAFFASCPDNEEVLSMARRAEPWGRVFHELLSPEEVEFASGARKQRRGRLSDIVRPMRRSSALARSSDAKRQAATYEIGPLVDASRLLSQSHASVGGARFLADLRMWFVLLSWLIVGAGLWGSWWLLGAWALVAWRLWHGPIQMKRV